MAVFSVFKMSATAVMDLQNLDFYLKKGQEDQRASWCQISWRSVKPLTRYGDISIFQNGGGRHLGSSKYGNCRDSRTVGPRGSKCVILPIFSAIGHTFAKIWRFFDFSKMEAVRHFGFMMRVFGPPAKSTWWFLLLHKIWLESALLFRRERFDGSAKPIFCVWW